MRLRTVPFLLILLVLTPSRLSSNIEGKRTRERVYMLIIYYSRTVEPQVCIRWYSKSIFLQSHHFFSSNLTVMLANLSRPIPWRIEERRPRQD